MTSLSLLSALARETSKIKIHLNFEAFEKMLKAIGLQTTFPFAKTYCSCPRDDRDGKVPWKRNIVFFGAAT
jgi:hypothetical protein